MSARRERSAGQSAGTPSSPAAPQPAARRGAASASERTSAQRRQSRSAASPPAAAAGSVCAAPHASSPSSRSVPVALRLGSDAHHAAQSAAARPRQRRSARPTRREPQAQARLCRKSLLAGAAAREATRTAHRSGTSTQCHPVLSECAFRALNGRPDAPESGHAPWVTAPPERRARGGRARAQRSRQRCGAQLSCPWLPAAAQVVAVRSPGSGAAAASRRRGLRWHGPGRGRRCPFHPSSAAGRRPAPLAPPRTSPGCSLRVSTVYTCV